MARTRSASPHIVIFLLILHVHLSLQVSVRRRSACLCKTRKVGEEFGRFRRIPPILTTCLRCNTTVLPESLEWIFLPNSSRDPADVSLPSNACLNRKTRSLILRNHEVSQYMNAGTYKCVNKENKSVVLCSFKVEITDHLETALPMKEGQRESIPVLYEYYVSKYRWFYAKKLSPTHFKELIPDDRGKVDYPCQMNIHKTSIVFDEMVLGCAGLYQVIADSSLANFSVSQITNVFVHPAPKSLSLKCPLPNPLVARVHETVTYKCSGTMRKRSIPKLTFFCRTADGKMQLNDTIQVRVSDSPERTVGRFHFGHSEIKSLLDEDLSIYLEIANISTADDKLTCSIIFEDTHSRFNKTFPIHVTLSERQLTLQNQRQRITIPLVTCLISMFVFTIILFHLAPEISALSRHLRERISQSNGNTVGCIDHPRP